MPFTTNLKVEKIDAWHWKLIEPLTYYGRRDKFTIPAGFITDWASVPQIFWSLVSPINLACEPSILHDSLYATRIVPRAQADGMFRRMLREAGVGFVRRWMMYLAVRTFGWVAWKDQDDPILNNDPPAGPPA